MEKQAKRLNLGNKRNIPYGGSGSGANLDLPKNPPRGQGLNATRIMRSPLNDRGSGPPGTNHVPRANPLGRRYVAHVVLFLNSATRTLLVAVLDTTRRVHPAFRGTASSMHLGYVHCQQALLRAFLNNRVTAAAIHD